MASQEIEEIKAKINLAEFIGEYVRLSPAGINNFKALCPFHNEKTPSFMVSPDKGIWHCFGCGEGGDVFAFLMKMESWEFVEALKFLAEKTGVVLQHRPKESQENRNSLYDVCALAAKYWQKILTDSPAGQIARDYLKSRGLTEEIISDWQIGYAPESWDNLLNFLIKRGFKEPEVFAAGLIVKKPQGYGFYDRFRNRIMFPLSDANGRVVGFSGRALKSDEQPQLNTASGGPAPGRDLTGQAKYINTPQTAIYNKSLIVFGLDKAKRAIKELDAVIIVEGQLDVITSHQYGFTNTVGSSGTALTFEQVKLLNRYSRNLLFALDADVAGQKAIDHGEDIVRNFISSSASSVGVDRFGRLRRFIDPLLSSGATLKVIEIYSGKDPDECIRNNPNDWQQAIDSAKPIMQYYFDRLFKNKDVNQPAERKIIIQFLLNKIIKINDPIERDYWLKVLAQKANASETVLREAVANLRSRADNRPASKNQEQGRQKMEIKPLDQLIWERIIALLLAFPQLTVTIADEPLTDIIEEKIALDLYKQIILFYTKNIDLFSAGVVDNSEFNLFNELSQWLKETPAEPDALKMLNEAFLLSQKDFIELDFKSSKDELDKLIKSLKSNFFSRRLNILKLELAEAENLQQTDKINQLLNELSGIINRKSQLS